MGALNADGMTRAIWSNYGDWVNCSSVGVGITSTFVEGNEHTPAERQVVTEYFDPNGWALWSGTSFSAPQIAGRVAQLCQQNNVDPPVALGQLLAGTGRLPAPSARRPWQGYSAIRSGISARPLPRQPAEAGCRRPLRPGNGRARWPVRRGSRGPAPQTGQVTMQIGTVSPVARSASGAHRRGNR